MNTRDQILIAAKAEFFAKGYDATRMRSIADRAEINKGLLHYYFKTKDALIVEVFQESFGALFGQIEDILKQEDKLFNVIESVVNAYVDFMIENPGLPVFIINEMRRDQKKHHARMKKANVKPPFRALVTHFDKAKERGEISKSAEPNQMVLSMMSLILFPIIASPVVKFMQNLNNQEYESLILERKKLITYTLIQSIKA